MIKNRGLPPRRPPGQSPAGLSVELIQGGGQDSIRVSLAQILVMADREDLGFDASKVPPSIEFKIPFSTVQDRLQQEPICISLPELLAGIDTRFHPPFSKTKPSLLFELPASETQRQIAQWLKSTGQSLPQETPAPAPVFSAPPPRPLFNSNPIEITLPPAGSEPFTTLSSPVIPAASFQQDTESQSWNPALSQEELPVQEESPSIPNSPLFVADVPAQAPAFRISEPEPPEVSEDPAPQEQSPVAEVPIATEEPATSTAHAVFSTLESPAPATFSPADTFSNESDDDFTNVELILLRNLLNQPNLQGIPDVLLRLESLPGVVSTLYLRDQESIPSSKTQPILHQFAPQLHSLLSTIHQLYHQFSLPAVENFHVAFGKNYLSILGHPKSAIVVQHAEPTLPRQTKELIWLVSKNLEKLKL